MEKKGNNPYKIIKGTSEHSEDSIELVKRFKTVDVHRLSQDVAFLDGMDDAYYIEKIEEANQRSLFKCKKTEKRWVWFDDKRLLGIFPKYSTPQDVYVWMLQMNQIFKPQGYRKRGPKFKNFYSTDPTAYYAAPRSEVPISTRQLCRRIRRDARRRHNWIRKHNMPWNKGDGYIR